MKILKVFPKNFQETIFEAKNSIQKGKILICPTDTLYGLVSDATNKTAAKKIFKIKKRPKGKPIPVFVKDIKMAKKLAHIDKNQEKILQKFWPGKFTFVLKRKNQLPSILFGQEKTIGLRIPKYNLIYVLLKTCNCPLTGTSANISDSSPSTKIKKVISQFKNQKYQPDLVLDVGDLKPSRPSTVIDLTNSKIKILRKGSGII